MCRLLLACCLSILAGCATSQQSREQSQRSSTPSVPVSAVVFVANGAGASRDGIDLFHSTRDRWVLGLGVRIVGTTDGDCRTPAGRVGFQAIVNNPADAALYAKLRQHPWDPSVEWSGHTGGHFGNLEPQ